MSKRHTNFCLQISKETADNDINLEMFKGKKKFGKFTSMHEAYAVIKEELDEFWESVKGNDPDPKEL